MDAKYSYGTVFWSDESEVIITENCTAEYKSTDFYSKGSLCLGTRGEETLEAKITNCAIDEDGDMCDVVATVHNITLYPHAPFDNNLGRYYGLSTDKTTPEDTIRVSMWLGRSTLFPDLAAFIFSTNEAGGYFDLTYLKHGTNKKANIHGAAGVLWDIDAQCSDREEDLWNGQEGFTIADADGEVYYAKDNWLIDVEGEKGIRVPDKSVGDDDRVENNNRLEKYSSAVAVEDFDNATYKLFYSGARCGMSYAFASPYPFKINNPTKSVSKTAVNETEKFTYAVKQYVPNNYYSTVLEIIAPYQYTAFDISDTLDSNLVIDGKITVTDEDGTDVSSFFDISQTNNKVTATLKAEYLKKAEFYASLYSLNIPVYAKSGAGKTSTTIKNTAKTTINRDDGEKTTMNSNTVSTKLVYNVKVEGIIDHGKVSVDNKKWNVRSGNSTVSNKTSGTLVSNALYFTVDEGYEIKTVAIDGKSVDVSSLNFDNGVYSYNFSDEIVDQDIAHRVAITTTPKNAVVNIHYVDEKGKTIALDQTQTDKKWFDVYETKAEDIYGYELTETPKNAKGIIESDQVDVTYVYRLKDTSIKTRWIDESGKELVSSEIKSGKVFDKYTTKAKTIYGYELKRTPSNANGEMKEEQIIITYVYALKDTSVVANYVDEQGNPLCDATSQTGKVFDKYETEQKEFYGYNLKEVQGEPNGEMTEEQINVTYVYELKDTSVVVKYVDEEGNELLDSVTINGKVFEKYETKEEIIRNYTLIELPLNANGTMEEDVITVVYVYALSDTGVVAHYVDEDGNPLAESERITGRVFDEYETEEKEIYGYELVRVDGESSGNMTDTTTVVTYIYKLKNAVVTVCYIDEDGNELREDITIYGKVFDPYKTEQKAFDGYEFVEVQGDVSGTMEEYEIVVTYIYKPIEVKDITAVVDTGSNSALYLVAGLGLLASMLLLISLYNAIKAKTQNK